METDKSGNSLREHILGIRASYRGFGILMENKQIILHEKIIRHMAVEINSF